MTFIINIQCQKTPNEAFKVIEDFLILRSQNDAIPMYDMFHENFTKDITPRKYMYIERIYKKRFGELLRLYCMAFDELIEYVKAHVNCAI